jgi:hypothetical protein
MRRPTQVRTFEVLAFVLAAATPLLLPHCSSATPGPSDDAGPAGDSALPLLDTGTIGIEEDAGDAGPPSCTLPPSGLSSDESCEACLQATCCEDIGTCFGDPACVVINTCLSSCFTGIATDGGIAACEAACTPDASGATASAAAAEISYLTGACALACPGPPTCGTPGGTYAQTCTGCQLVGGALTCSCVDNANGSLVTTITLCGCLQPPVVTNANGVLTCALPDAGGD